MKKMKCVLALVLALLMLSACSGEPGAPAPPSASDRAPVGSGSPAPAGTTEGREYVGAIDVTGMPKKELENKKITIYCWGEYVPEKLYDWQGFRFIDYYGGEIEVIQSSGDYYENLYKLVAAGEIPDIVVGEAKSFPTMIMRDLVQPWDTYVDFTDPAWEQTGALADIENLKWNGQVYDVTGKAHTLGVLFYNERILAETGLEDPMELQAKGEWNWDAFRRYLDETTVDNDGDGVIDTYGMVNTGDFPIALFASAGETHIEFDGSTFINNVKSQKVQDAANFLYEIGVNGSQFMTLGDPVGDFLNGKAAFVYTNDYRGYVDYANLWGTDGIGVVPMPAYSGAEQQHQAALTDNLWLMKGAKHPEGAALMVLAERYDTLLNMDPEAGSTFQTEVNLWKGRGFSENAAKAVAQINEMPTKVIFSRSVTMADGNLEYRAMDEPWTTLADSVSGSVDKAIADATKPILEE